MSGLTAAVGAWLEWTDLPEKEDGKAGKKTLLPLPLAADSQSAKLTLPARQNGSVIPTPATPRPARSPWPTST